MDLNSYEVVWPRGRQFKDGSRLARRLQTLEGKTIAQLWDWIFKGDKMFEVWERELKKRYPGVSFVDWREFGEIHGHNERKVLESLPEKFARFGVDAALVGVGCCGSCTAGVTPAAIHIEKMGIPTVSMICSGFEMQGKMTAKGLQMPNLPYTVHPGHVNFATDEELDRIAAGVMLDQVIRGLTVQPTEEALSTEPGATDVVFRGNYNAVQQEFLKNEWSEGLPVVPPTREAVEEFLRFTDRDPDEVLGLVLPDNREATVWNIAVNGVISGCRPEYMPVLLALVDAMVDPTFGVEHLGQTPGTETLIIVLGKIIKDLKFNHGQGLLRPGFQANTSIARFWRMYLRNIGGFLPGKADKGCYGGNFRIVVAEDEAACAEVSWPTHGEDEGLRRGENAVTITACTEMTQAIEVGDPEPEQILKNIEARMADNNMFIQFFFRGMVTRPTVILTPLIMRQLAAKGWTKEAVRRHLYENAKLRVSRLSGMILNRFYKGINDRNWPEQLGTSMDVERDIQMVSKPEDFLIVIAGDPARDHVMIGSSNGYIGFPVTKRVTLPADWDRLLSGETEKIAELA
ncbi:UGSC family (seleno)protein [Amaricoccus solimangrovi]|uniref:UGSC-like domain-containing protein n=1 Tax=Amaricoccus solimangrovi TaxID=2589815 RepID=A0A501WNM0_9RHOB|nr:hypothetical protein [Amaricoccus solimangrovi]TPE47326.1 hypothetical protein FJM51_20320 [Amaricoccus solimangrovi]